MKEEDNGDFGVVDYHLYYLNKPHCKNSKPFKMVNGQTLYKCKH